MDREEARSPADEAFERFVVPELEVLVRVARSLTYREAARVLSIRAGTVMSRLHRARRRVRATVATT